MPTGKRPRPILKLALEGSMPAEEVLAAVEAPDAAAEGEPLPPEDAARMQRGRAPRV